MKRYCMPCRAVLLWLASGVLSVGYAQVATNITPTVGPGDLGTTVTQAGTSFDITGGTRPNNGPNLFHSFGGFSVGTGDTASFVNDSGLATENILSRVTGGNPSNIFGTLGTAGFSGAELYLVNPAGVLFGPGASLDVEGGFHVTTADFIELADGVRFDAMPSPNDALLTTALPAAFGFLDSPIAPIRVLDSTLDAKGRSLTVVGGNIEVKGGAVLKSPGGRMNLASLASAGEVRLGNSALEIESSGPLGTITMQGSTLDVSEAPGGTTGAGNVFIRAGQFVVDNSDVLAKTVNGNSQGIAIDLNLESLLIRNGGSIETSSSGPGNAGNVTINARKEVVLADGIILPNGDVTNSRVLGMGTRGQDGDSGNVVIKAGRLELRDGSIIDVSGKRGSVEIQAEEIVLKGKRDNSVRGGLLVARLRAASLGSEPSEPSGNITINADRIFLTENGTITVGALFQGPGGNLTINARELQLNDRGQILAETARSGAGGKIDITATDILLRQGEAGSRISTQSRSSAPDAGPSGNIVIRAHTLRLLGSRITSETARAKAGGIVLKVGVLLDLRDGSTIATTAATQGGEGDGGGIFIIDPVLVVLDHSRIIANARQGLGGNVSINAIELQLSNRSEIRAETRESGAGGQIGIRAANIELRDGSLISSESTSSAPNAGHSGEIFVRAADNLRLFSGSEISVDTKQANAGSIDLDVGFLLHLRDGSSITTSVAGGQGDGGNISIDPVFTVLDGGSRIIARAREGRGGNIRIVSDFLFVSPDSLIDASSELGVSGVVDVESPETDVVSGALALPESFLDAASLLSDRCTARAIKGASRFIVSGRGGVPPGPETVLPSFPELGLNEAPKAKGSASVSQGTIPVGCAIE